MGNGLPNYFKNLSPSKVNGFLEWRSKWFLTDVLKRRLPPTPEMERGKAVEQGITQFLIGNLDLEQSQEWANKLYREGTKDLDIDDSNEAAVVIPDLVKAGIEALKPYGKVSSVQRKVHAMMDGTALDWFGYADIGFDDDSTIIDLKVTGKTPSAMSYSHCRQGSFYQKFIPGCKKVDFIYLVPLKGGVKTMIHTVPDADKHIHDLRMGAIAMDKMLSISDNPDDLKHYFIPAPGDWWLKDPMAMAHAAEVWGISDFTPAKELDNAVSS